MWCKEAQKPGTEMGVCMNDIEVILRRMLLSNLQARFKLHKLDLTALACEIGSPLTAWQRIEEAIYRTA
jgi:hypothetical protein